MSDDASHGQSGGKCQRDHPKLGHSGRKPKLLEPLNSDLDTIIAKIDFSGEEALERAGTFSADPQ